MFILVIIDAFSRWVELYPTKTTTAVETAYSGEENDIVERANQEVLRHLNAILFDSRSMTDGHSSSYLWYSGS